MNPAKVASIVSIGTAGSAVSSTASQSRLSGVSNFSTYHSISSSRSNDADSPSELIISPSSRWYGIQSSAIYRSIGVLSARTWRNCISQRYQEHTNLPWYVIWNLAWIECAVCSELNGRIGWLVIEADDDLQSNTCDPWRRVLCFILRAGMKNDIPSNILAFVPAHVRLSPVDWKR